MNNMSKARLGYWSPKYLDLEDNYLITESKTHRKKTAQELTAELNSSWKQPVSLSKSEKLRSTGYIAIKKTPFTEEDKAKRLSIEREPKFWTDEFKFEHFCSKRRVWRESTKDATNI